MLLGILTLITALCISAVAIYYSVAGLVAIFAAAALPIMIMGSVLEVSKLVTAVWLHKYWKQATWWLKTYLSVAVFVLMLITSMGIFGFLSKAHIEQTAQSTDNIARVETLQSEIDRNLAIVGRAENRIRQLESSETGADSNIQSQIDKEQERIDRAFERIQPAIQQQNQIINDARDNDATRTKPYEDQLTSIQAEVLRLEQSAREYESKISTLEADTSAVQPLLDSISNIEAEIIRVTNQLQSGERDQVRAGQAIIGVSSDGAFGGNTRRALVAWVDAQRARITQVQLDVSQLRQDSTAQVDAERTRLAAVVSDIRTTQIPALKEREIAMLGKIDEVRQTESPAIATARNEIQRLRESAEAQVAQSQTLITRLQAQLANSDNADEVQKAIDEQSERVRLASLEIESLTDEKITLESEYRKLEAEVGPVKYIAEFVYGEDANNNMLEEAVRWVIITIIFVFDPLAVLLLIASQYTFEWRSRKDDDGERLRLERAEYERARAQAIVDNPGVTFDDLVPPDTSSPSEDDGQKEEVNATTDIATADDDNGDVVPEDDTTNTDDSATGMEQPQVPLDEDAKRQIANSYIVEESKKKDPQDSVTQDTLSVEVAQFQELQTQRAKELQDQDADEDWVSAKQSWKDAHPNLTLKTYKNLYLEGKIDELPWEQYKTKKFIAKEGNVQVNKETSDDSEGYIQNAEQSESSLWKKIQKNNPE